eukprot:scaffold103095_cov20-Prasinocladus_malaysianus.AAC.1
MAVHLAVLRPELSVFEYAIKPIILRTARLFGLTSSSSIQQRRRKQGDNIVILSSKYCHDAFKATLAIVVSYMLNSVCCLQTIIAHAAVQIIACGGIYKLASVQTDSQHHDMGNSRFK